MSPEEAKEKRPLRVFGEDEEDAPKKKKAPSGKKKKKKKKAAKAWPENTILQLGRGLRAGSVTAVRYGRRAMRFFNDVAIEDKAKRPGPEKEPGKIETYVKTRPEWIRKNFAYLVAGVLLLAVLLAVFFNNTSLQVEQARVSVAGLSRDLEGYTILLLSDMHGREYGARQATLLREISSVKYDLVVLAGDMVGAKGNAQALYDLLDGLPGDKPVYFIAGDSDPGPLLNEPRVVPGKLEGYVLEEWVLGAIAHGGVYLDSPESIKVGDSTIWLTPGDMLNVESSSTVSALNQQVRMETGEVLEEKQAAYNALPFTSYRQQNMSRLQESISEMKTEDLHIAVSHIPPRNAPRVSDGTDGYLPTVDLILAGHYCGGGWKLPMVGAFYIPSEEAPRHGWFPAREEVEGLRLLGSVSLYVTGGLNMTDAIWLPDFRLNNQPKVTFLTLTAALTDDLLGIGR